MDDAKIVYKRVLVTSLLLFVMLFGGSLFTPAEAATEKVKLLSAKISPLYTRGVLKGYKSSGYIVVRESGFEEKVVIHYSYGGDWKEVKAEFVGMDQQQQQIWKFETPEIKPSFHYYKFTSEFAINYQKDGKNYWDNNQGSNYFLRMTNVPYFSNRPYLLGSLNVLLDHANYQHYNGNTTLSGEVLVKNLAYNKDIQIVYTTNNWETKQYVTARYYSKYDDNLEKWRFAIRNLAPNAKIKYRVKYTVNGNTYWDDNFGRDYKVN